MHQNTHVCGFCLATSGSTETIPRPRTSSSFFALESCPSCQGLLPPLNPMQEVRFLRAPGGNAETGSQKHLGWARPSEVARYSNQGAPAYSNQLPLGEGHIFWKDLGILSKGALRSMVQHPRSVKLFFLVIHEDRWVMALPWGFWQFKMAGG